MDKKKDHFHISFEKTTEFDGSEEEIRCENCVYATTAPGDFPCNECKHINLEVKKDD